MYIYIDKICTPVPVELLFITRNTVPPVCIPVNYTNFDRTHLKLSHLYFLQNKL